MNITQAALFNVGCGPIIALLITILVVGVVVYFAKPLIAFIPMDDRWKTLLTQLVVGLAILYTVLVALDILFGINIGGVRPIACG